MNNVWISYKGVYLLQLSDTSWGIHIETEGRYWRIKVFDDLEKALRWIDGD